MEASSHRFSPWQERNSQIQYMLSVGVLVCQQDYTDTTEQISSKLGWRMDLGPEQTSLTSGADSGFFCSLSLTLHDMAV